MNDLSAGEQKIVRYLIDAHANERRLETALAHHAGEASRAPYRTRLERHRRETRDHAKAIERRVKELGGRVESVGDRAPDVVAGAAQTAQSMARRAAAMAQEGVRAVRGTGDAEADLANAKADYAEEAREIASYRALEALAEALGDRQTAMLAKRLRREEERMAASLEKLIPELVRAAVREEIAPPRSPGTAGAAKRRSRSSSRVRAGTSRAPAARKPAARRPRASARKS